MRISRTTLGIVLTLAAAASANADLIKTLDFAGTATCETGFVFQECSSGGAVTGSYNLDVTTQTISGDWSFNTPYGVISSALTGSSAGVGTQTLANGLDDVAFFQVNTTSPSLDEELALYFTAPNADELGTVYSNGGTSLASAICQNIPGNSPAGCEPDVQLAGTTTATPEPGSLVLLGTALAFWALRFMRQRRRKLTCF